MSRLLGLADWRTSTQNYALRLPARGASVAVGDPMSFSSAISQLAEALVDTPSHLTTVHNFENSTAGAADSCHLLL